tara:strand:- start:646 stop:1095 length:450 start_codon:yes stop_codon:yes gene_type:complete
MTSAHRPRRIVLETLTKASRSARNRSYRVKRGPVNWSTWNFSDFPRGISILQDQGDLFPATSRNGMRHAQISIEIFAKLTEDSKELGTDESISEELLDDVELILYGLATSQQSGSPVIFNLDLPSTIYTEHHDSNSGVQGFVFTFSITY